MEKYGGSAGPPSFEIFNSDGNTAFTVDASTKKTQTATMVEYDVRVKTGTAAQILMKTGLNFILSLDMNMKTFEKATLIAAVLAMVQEVNDFRVSQNELSNELFFIQIEKL